MIVQFDNEFFSIEHLEENTELSDFIVKKGKGLEYYLKNNAKDDERTGMSRTYIIRSTTTYQIVAYFTLRTGLITVSRGFMNGFDAYTGIELANFAVNDNYRRLENEIPKLGTYLFMTFILPLTKEISKYVGAAYLYIYALPNNRLMEHYKTMGFRQASFQMEHFVYRHVKPFYDKGCRFMFQKI